MTDTSPENVARMLQGVMLPDDEPRLIVCTGEAGSNTWQPAFGTWEADDFGMDSDEPLGEGERLFVNRRIFDALASRLAEVEAASAGLMAILDRNDKKGPIPEVEQMFCWMAAQDLRNAIRRAALQEKDQ